MPFSAPLDACVLYPSTLRDTLLRLAEKELYRPLWSDLILEEMRRNILKDRPDLRSDQLEHLVGQMKLAFEEALVSGFDSLIEAMTNDPKDRHVLAAAVIGRADVIVTSNLKDFPDSSCDPYSIEVQSPDEFLTHTLHLAPGVVIGALQEQARTNRRFPNTLDDVLKVALFAWWGLKADGGPVRQQLAQWMQELPEDASATPVAALPNLIEEDRRIADLGVQQPLQQVFAKWIQL